MIYNAETQATSVIAPGGKELSLTSEQLLGAKTLDDLYRVGQPIPPQP